MADGDGKNGAGDEGTKRLLDDPDFKALTEMVGTLGRIAKTTQEGQRNLETRVGTLVETLEKGIPDQSAGNKPVVKTDDDLNSMSQSELVVHLLKSTKDMLAESMKPIAEQIAGNKDDADRSNLAGHLKSFAEDHPDIVDFGPELTAILDVTPNITLERAYSLVRLENPDKAKELDTKYSDEAKDEKPPPFGGLTPTSTVLRDGDEPPEKMTKQEAGEKAWEETLKSFPALELEEG